MGISDQSSWQNWCTWVRLAGLLAPHLPFSATHMFSIRLRSGLCDWDHSNTLTLLYLSHFVNNLEECLGHCSFGRAIWAQASTSWLMPSDAASIYPHNFLFSWCHLNISPSCSKTAPQHDAVTPILHSWDGVLRLQSFHLFPPTIRFIMAQQFSCFVRPHDMSPEIEIFVPVCSCKL